MKQSIPRPVRQNSTNGGPKRTANNPTRNNNSNTFSRNSNAAINDSEKAITDKLINLIARSVGKQCIATVSSGARYQGLLLSADLSSSEPTQNPSSLSVIIQNPRIYSNALVDEKNNISSDLPEKLIIQSKNLMDLEVQEVDDQKDSPNPAPVTSPVAATNATGGSVSFKTDTDISGKLKVKERELQRWVPDDDSTMISLEDSSGGKWDQFKVNEEKFGVESTYDEHLYTTRIDTSAPDYQERLKYAEKLAKEIEGQVTNDPHLLEERGFTVDDSGLDEEDKYSGVDRRGDELMAALRGVNINIGGGAPSAATTTTTTTAAESSSPGKYLPPRQRAAQYHNDPAIISSSATSTKNTENASDKKSDSSLPAKPPVPNESFRLNAQSEINSLREFSANFKIPHKLPQDLLPILSKDKLKQDEIIKKQDKKKEENSSNQPATETGKKKMDPKKAAFIPNVNAAAFTPSTKAPVIPSPTAPPPNFNKSPQNPSPRIGHQRPYSSGNNSNIYNYNGNSSAGSSGSGISKRHHITAAEFFGGVDKIPTKEGQIKKVEQFKQAFNMFFTVKAKSSDKSQIEFERTYVTPPTWESTVDVTHDKLFESPSTVEPPTPIISNANIGFIPNPMMGGIVPNPQSADGGFMGAGAYPGGPNAGKFAMSPHQHQQQLAAMAHFQQQQFQAAMMYQQQQQQQQQQQHQQQHHPHHPQQQHQLHQQHHPSQQPPQQHAYPGGIPPGQPPIPMYGPGSEAFLPPGGYIPNNFVGGGGSPVNGHMVMGHQYNNHPNNNATNKHGGRKYSHNNQNPPTGIKKGKSTE